MDGAQRKPRFRCSEVKKVRKTFFTILFGGPFLLTEIIQQV